MPPKPPTAGEDELWAAAVAGDPDAFTSLYDRHVERVFRHACRLVGSRTDAEDITASAFLELWRRRGDVTLYQSSVLPWLLVTATNVGRNLTRTRLRYRRLLQRLPRTSADGGPDAADSALSSLGSQAYDPDLQAALSRLPRTDLALVTLVMLEGYRLEEAAAVLAMSPSAAKSRLHRLRTRLRRDLSPTETPEGATSWLHTP